MSVFIELFDFQCSFERYFCIEVGISPLDTEVLMSKKKQPDERIRYNRDTLIEMQSSAYALTTPKCVLDAMETRPQKTWCRQPFENKRKATSNKDTIIPSGETKKALPLLRPRPADDLPAFIKNLQNKGSGDQPLNKEKIDEKTTSSGMTSIDCLFIIF